MKTKLLLSLFVTLISVSILFSKYNEIVNTALDNNEIPQEIIKTHQNKFFGAVTDQWSKQKAKQAMEKWVLREAFGDMLPESVAWRQKEQFSDGVGYSWIDTLKELVNKEVSDDQMENAKYRFPI